MNKYVYRNIYDCQWCVFYAIWKETRMYLNIYIINSICPGQSESMCPAQSIPIQVDRDTHILTPIIDHQLTKQTLNIMAYSTILKVSRQHNITTLARILHFWASYKKWYRFRSMRAFLSKIPYTQFWKPSLLQIIGTYISSGGAKHAERTGVAATIHCG